LPIQAPETPRAIRTRGPRQQADASTAATPPAINDPRPDLDSDFNSDIVIAPFMALFDKLSLKP